MGADDQKSQQQQTRCDAVQIVASEQLFQSARKVCIKHAGQHYLLRITRENKLILTK